jgi:hypothetical protein
LKEWWNWKSIKLSWKGQGKKTRNQKNKDHVEKNNIYGNLKLND